MKKKEEEKINKTADIHIRCYPEDKDNVVARAKDGFGKDTNSITNLVLYAIRHADDTSPIALSYVDSLIRAIGMRRQELAEVHSDISRISDELNAAGNNINQIAKGINTILKIAREDDVAPQVTIDSILAFQGEVQDAMKDMDNIIDKYEKNIRTARTRVNSCLRKEDELLTKTLVHPRVGKFQTLEAQLLRLMEEYIEGDQIRFGQMNVVSLLFELREKVKANTIEGEADNSNNNSNIEEGR